MVSAGVEEEANWFVREVGFGSKRQLWHITDRTATRAYVSNPEGGVGTYYTAKPGQTIWACLRNSTPWFEDANERGPFVAIRLAPGQYHRRIARPVAMSDDERPVLPDLAAEQRYLIGAQEQLSSLISDLRAICRVVQPAPACAAAYGHEIRNLLILAATESEMHWRGILRANGVTEAKAKSTSHYVALTGPLNLASFAVRFHAYPEIGRLEPFAGWNRAEPTKSLGWYAAYNGVKHNRELEFESASLGNAFSAVAACAVLLVAQFGKDALTSEQSALLSIDVPTWPIEDMYLPPHFGKEWAAVPHLEFGA